MKRIDHIIRVVSAIFIVGMSASSCIYEEEADSEHLPGTIRVNTLAVDGARMASAAEEGFMVLFWLQKEHLEQADGGNGVWPAPYLASNAPQPVTSYGKLAYDTHYPYPYPETTSLYATGYAPCNVLKLPADETVQNYRKLMSTVGAAEKGRYDFLGCDVWSEVYEGSQNDPFAQEKNKLYFRHLAAKLVFYADRDRQTMENKQYVRNVQIRNLQMSIDDKTWTPMYTPSVFEWKELTPETDFTQSYKNTIATVKLVTGNESAAAGSRPKAGYKAVEAETFAGDKSDFVLQKDATDRIPIEGIHIDSCYVCNPIADGNIITDKYIRLKMDISAELSFDPNFPMKDDKSDIPNDGSGSITDDLTFTRTWENVELDAIYRVNIDKEGKVQTTNTAIREFKPGNEYRIYIHFSRTGVNLVAQELPWDIGGVHYIMIPGGTQQNDKQENK